MGRDSVTERKMGGIPLAFWSSMLMLMLMLMMILFWERGAGWR